MTKQMWLGAGMLAAVVWCWSAAAQQTYTADPATFGARPLVTHFQEQQNGATVLTVVEPQTRVIAVYHISGDTGEIKLKSVRNFELDLRLDNHNSSGLTPEQIRNAELRQQ